MELEDIFSKNKWATIQALAQGPASASEIAQKTGQSTANTLIQLQLLEASQIIKKVKNPNTKDMTTEKKESLKSKEQTKTKNTGPGKPKTRYELIQEVVMVSIVRPGLAAKKILKIKEMDPFQEITFHIQATCPENFYPIAQYCCKGSIPRKAETIAFLKAEGNEVELFIITDNLDEIRKNYSQFTAEDIKGKTKKIISWSHNRKEIEEGLGRGEEYFVDLVKNSRILLDQKSYLSELKKRLKG
ncbi:winged helix-turn-helix transcriptional regulator [Candidatus Woesearchaeota archaeon]|nr:winged helix-turn-helix transcriptional regulator [Candidatus Woesearchaeota archaeon]